MMEEQTGQESFGLPKGKMLRIADGGGALLQVWEGEVWLTQEGSTKDHVLIAGQSFRLDRAGLALVYPFRRSVLSLARGEQHSAGALRRFWADLVAPAQPKSLSF
jgi:hypothetical protein